MTALHPGVVLLAMDFQSEIVAMLSAGGSEAAVARAREAVVAARRMKVPVIYVMVAYRPDYADASRHNKRVSVLREQRRLIEGAAKTGIVPDLAPVEGEAVVIKRRVSALARTDLETLLSAHEARTLVLCGLSTSGVVLSTVRQAADLDYRIVVLGDACADPDPEVHRVLMTKIFPSQAEVMPAVRFCEAVAVAGNDVAVAPALQF
jgi:nicotinamidase-related amidase